MLILTIRTNKQEAELGLYEGTQQLVCITWQAHRQLAETIHRKIKVLLDSQNQALSSLNGLVVFKGPGSFTGLRIGLSVANALAYSLNIPIVGEKTNDWIQRGIKNLADRKNELIIVPAYGSPPHITKPRR